MSSVTIPILDISGFSDSSHSREIQLMTGISSFPREVWQTLHYGGRDFHLFSIPVNETSHHFTVPFQLSERYKILEPLARGGGGVILIAEDLHTGHEVLVKAIAGYQIPRASLEVPVDDAIDSVRRARHHLQCERRILVQLLKQGCQHIPHPNDYVFDWNPALSGPYRTPSDEVWTFDDHQLMQSEPYLVMQRVPGQNAKELLRNTYRGGFPEQQALYLIDQIAAVLEKLELPISMPHGQTWKLVYQDLKPSNILVDDYGHATLIDFGGCQIVIEDELVLHGSHSPGYAAPECGLDQGPIKSSADVFSLGTTLFGLLTGMNLRNELKRLQESMDLRMVPLDYKKFADKISEPVRELIKNSARQNPEERIQTVKEFRAQLQECII